MSHHSSLRATTPPLGQITNFFLNSLDHITLIEMLGEFFLIYNEGRRCKVIYDENIFPHIWRKIPQIFPKYDENFYLRGKFPSNFPYIWRKHLDLGKNSSRFSLNMTKISILGENSPKFFLHMTKSLGPGKKFPQIFPKHDENFYLREKFPSNFPYIWRKH